MTCGHAYGYIKDAYDKLDYRYVPRFKLRAGELPRKLLVSCIPPVKNQGNLGSCTAFATGNLHHRLQIKQKDPSIFDPSELFLYYATRAIEGTINQDSGAQIRNSIKAAVKNGICSDRLWPYDISKFKMRPSDAAIAEAYKNQALEYARVDQSINALKQCLADDNAFTFGFSVFDSFESDYVARTGFMPMPTRYDRVRGGHAVICIGYDDEKQVFTILNSWGTQWGDNGLFYMPYAFMANREYVQDIWTIYKIEGDTNPAPKPEPDTVITDVVESLTITGRDLKVQRNSLSNLRKAA